MKVALYQYRLLHYRLSLFEKLREQLAQDGVDLVLVHGQPTDQEASRRDTGHLPWALQVCNRSIRLGGRDILWQPDHPKAEGAVLKIVMQESRILSNYPMLMRRSFGRGSLVAFWGHGRNFQSTHPAGAREQWKGFWLRRADWWFAYTESTRAHLVKQGYSDARISVLNNAIDDRGFAQDLAAVTSADLDAARLELGLGASACVAVHCGSLYAEKRIDVLVAAGDMLRQRLPDFHLLVLGDGPLAGCLRDAAATRPWLHPLGPKQGRAKALAFRLAAVQLNPGLVGLHVVDSFVAGTPLVTQADALHSPEFAYLQDGVNGRAVVSDSVAAYAGAVAELFENPKRLAELQAACRQDAARYSQDSMVGRFAQGIVQCLRFHGHAVPERTSGELSPQAVIRG